MEIGLGAGTNVPSHALSFGRISLTQEFPVTKLASPAALALLGSLDLKKINDATGLRQVLSGQMFADIVTNGAFAYEVRLYAATNSGVTNGSGLYQPVGSPLKTVVVENPDASTNFNRLWITEFAGNVTNAYKYSFTTNSRTWELVLPSNLRKDTLATTYSSDRRTKTNLLSVYNPGSPDVLVYREQNRFVDAGQGDMLVEQIIDPDGLRYTNTWSYYTNIAQPGSVGRLQSHLRWDGYWESFVYDSQGRETIRTFTFLNASNGSSGSVSHVVTSSYTNVTPQLTRIEQVLGQEVGRSYEALFSNSNCVKRIRCVTPGAAWNDTNNLVTTTTRDSFFRPTNVFYPDGTKAIYSYVENTSNKTFTTTVTTGQPVGYGIGEGTRSITVTGSFGEMLSNIVQNVTGGTADIILEQDSYSYAADDYAKAFPMVTHLDGTQTTGSGGCSCTPNLGNSVAKDGTVTYFTFDALNRRTSTTLNGVTITNIMDGAGQVIGTARMGTDGSSITLGTRAYDLAGRVVAATNALGGVTVTGTYLDGSGQLVIASTNLTDGSTRIETRYRDGQLASITGTAVAPVRYEYGVESESGTQRLYTKAIRLDASGSDTGEWTKTYTDMLGRTYKTVYPDNAASVQAYNNKGQLSAQSDPDGVTMLYQYNGKGELEFTGVDVNTNGVLDFTGSDRITQTVSDVVNDAVLGNVRRTRTYVLKTDGSASSNLVATAMASTDGLRSWSIAWNGSASVTNQSATVYVAASGLRIDTVTAPDGSSMVTTNQYGRPISVTRRDSLNNQLSSIAYGYDSHGRPSSVTDARNGTATFGFNNADQISGTLTPAPGSGQSAQLTTNFFDALGRVWKTTLADGTSVTNVFALTGSPQLVSGSRTYASGSGYDPQGRFKSLTNWSTFPSTGARATTWNYDSQRGWLTGKSYPDNTGPSYGFTPAGRLQSRTWARGTNATYSYSKAGDLIGTTYNDGSAAVTMGFNRLGRSTAVTNGAAICAYAFNDLGLLLGESNAGGVLSGLVLSNKFDAFLRRTNVALLASGSLLLSSTAYAFDSASRFATVGDGTNTATYSYIANSPLIDNVAYKQSGTVRLTRTNQFDQLNRLTNLVWMAGGTVVASFAYQYNDANQRTRVTLMNGSYWLYQYDPLGQLTSAKKYWSDSTPVAGQQTTFGFDDIGNRTTASSGGDASGGGLRSANYGANLLNQYTNRTVAGYVDVLGEATNTATVTMNLQPTYRRSDYFRAELTVTNTSPLWFGVTNIAVLNQGTNEDIIATNFGNVFLPATPETFSHDRDGNLTNDGRWSYTWDAENRATSFTRISGAPSGSKVKLDCVYDYRWRRAQKIVSTWNGSTYVAQSTNKFIYDGWNLVAILDGTNGLVQSFVWGSDASGTLQGAGGVGGLISTTLYQGTNAGTYFYCYDGNHNVTALVNAANGAVAGRWEHDAFLNVLRSTGPLAFLNPFLGSTKFYDWETGFYYYGYRYYDPNTGRWLGQDPIGERGSLCLYGAYDNDAINSVDSDGRIIFKPFGIAMRYLADKLDGAADQTSSQAWAATASFLASAYRISADFVDPSWSDYVDRTVQRYDNAGKIYDQTLGPCGKGGKFWAGWSAGAYFLGDYLGQNGLPEWGYGNDLVTGRSLDGFEKWSRGLGWAGGTILLATPAVGKFEFANRPLSFSFLEAPERTALNPAAIRFSQSSVSGVEEIAASMRANGWQGAPIDVVRMSDGALTTFDNTRVLAASRAGIDVQAVVREAGEAFPAGRWTPRSGIQPTTWEQAVQARIQQQNRLFRQTYPNGSAVTGSAQ